MKKIILLMLTIALISSLVSCSVETSEKSSSQLTVGESEAIDERPDNIEGFSSILNVVTEDFNSTIGELSAQADTLYDEVGDTYDDYVKNSQLILDYYELMHSEFIALSERTTQHSYDYFREVVATIDNTDSDAIEDAMDDFYDDVYEYAYDEFYDSIYEDIYDDIYDMYYDGIIDDANDTVEYSEWSDTRSEAYENWSDARSETYEQWSDARSEIYENWTDVRSEFRNDNFDIEAILNFDASVELHESLINLTTEMQNEFETTISTIENELISVYDEVGDSYADYVSNRQLISEWYALTQEQTNELFEQIALKSVDYYKEVVSVVDTDDADAIETAMEYFYDTIYEEAFDSYYERIYENIFDALYETYYDGIIADALDTEDYSEWLDISSEAYSDWLDANSNIYSTWLDANSDLYSIWLDVNSEIIWNDNYDIDAIITSSNATEDNVETETLDGEDNLDNNNEIIDNASDDETSGDAGDGIRPEFKEAIDTYEAFFDEYIEFMKKYSESESDVSLLGDYMDFIEEYADTMEKLTVLETQEMSTEEMLYYTEAMLRINNKLLELT